jgi:glycerophosphoryl diester phosphodiesterase/HEAT repeat protein
MPVTSSKVFAVIALALNPGVAFSGILDRGPTRMMCHRTANRDVPENTLESLAFASRMGCSVVEIDLRVTRDGQVVLNHDGMLERLTNSMGDIETSYFEELEMLDAGSWMNGRFRDLRIPRFTDALHLAREQGVGLVLDLKEKGMAPLLVPLLTAEGMLDHVRVGGEKQADPTASVEPPVTEEAVRALHKEGKSVIANFSANGREMDLTGMRAAVAAGVDWINVDYPRLGADAIGQPVENKIATLIGKAQKGVSSERAKAILELAHYYGFPLLPLLNRWLLANDDEVSHAAAAALLIIRPAVPPSVFVSALQSPMKSARKNAAWALGMQSAPEAEALSVLLSEDDAEVLQHTLLAISHCAGYVPASRLEPFLKHPNPRVRGAAALALARHDPEVAAIEIPRALAIEEASIAKDYEIYVKKGKPPLSQPEIDITVNLYRCLMKMIESGTLMSVRDGLSFFNHEAFRSAKDYSSTVGPVAAFQLWDRIAVDPKPAIAALASEDIEVANRAEWTLAKAGPGVLGAVRNALRSPNEPTRNRAIRILAWQEDAESLPLLRAMRGTGDADPLTLYWAIDKIQSFAAASQ